MGAPLIHRAMDSTPLLKTNNNLIKHRKRRQRIGFIGTRRASAESRENVCSSDEPSADSGPAPTTQNYSRRGQSKPAVRQRLARDTKWCRPAEQRTGMLRTAGRACLQQSTAHRSRPINVADTLRSAGVADHIELGGSARPACQDSSRQDRTEHCSSAIWAGHGKLPIRTKLWEVRHSSPRQVV